MRTILLTATAALVGCAPTQPTNDTADEGAATGSSENIVSENVVMGASTPQPTPTPATADTDQCGAADHQWLVGENRSRIPEEPEGATWRIACTSCPVTQDYSPERMNIFYDEETEIVASVSCG